MKKKIVLVLTAVSLCAVMVVGGTLAYLTNQTETLENILKFDSGGDGSETAVGIEIAEPKWTGGWAVGTDSKYTGSEAPTGRTIKYQWDDAVVNADGTFKISYIDVPAKNKKIKGSDENAIHAWGEIQPFYDSVVIDKDPVVANNTNVAAFVGVAISLSQESLTKYNELGQPIYQNNLPVKYGLSWNEFDQLAQLKFAPDGADTVYSHNDNPNRIHEWERLPISTTNGTWGNPTVAKNGWALVKQTDTTRYYVYKHTLKKKNDVTKALDVRNATNESVSKRLFEVVYVDSEASKVTFDNGKVVNLANKVVNPNYDPAFPEKMEREGIAQYITKTDNVFIALRDNSGLPTGANPIAASALQLNVRAYATQAEIETNSAPGSNQVLKNNWNVQDTVNSTQGPLYALNYAFPHVFQD